MALLAGCVGTAPPRLYTLSMAPTGAVKPNVNIEVARLHPLEALSSSEIVIRRSEHELDTYPLDHWASSIGELVSEKLGAEFGDASPDRMTLALSGDILAFEQVDTGAGAAEARATLALDVRKKGDSRYAEPLLTKTYRAQSPIADAVTPARVVAALSRAVETIAQEVASDVNALDLSAAPVASTRELLHTLDMTPSGKAIAPLNIDVTSLRRSEALSRNSILIRPNPTTVEYFPDDRWAASVSTVVSEKLEAEFGAPVTARETVQLTGTIVAFERLDTPQGAVGHVKLDATLQGGAQQGQSRPLLWKVYEASSPAGGNSAAAVAVALSHAVEEVAASIMADAERIPPAATTPRAPEVHLFTLDMTPSGKVQCKHNVMFDRVQPNDSLTRADILIVRDETIVDRYPHDRWASGLAELVPEKLTAEFGHAVEGRRTVNIGGAISGFEQIENAGAGRAALVKLNLAFRWADSASDQPVFRRMYEAAAPIDGEGALAAVKALSRAVEEIAVRVAADIDALPEPETPKS
jgi:ABC-type uncharacterized transport system auxiliary subunit